MTFGDHHFRMVVDLSPEWRKRLGSSLTGSGAGPIENETTAREKLMYEPFDESTSESNRAANKGVWKPESGKTSASMFRQITGTLADGMNRAAATLHEKTGDLQSNDMSNLSRKTADWLERSATYVSDLEPAQIRTDLETQVRKSPGKSLLIAGAAGLLLGAFLRQRR